MTEKKLTLEDAVLGAIAAIDAVPDTERVLEARVDQYHADDGGYFWTIRAQHEYGSHEHLYKVHDAKARKDDAKRDVLRCMAKLEYVIDDADGDESPD